MLAASSQPRRGGLVSPAAWQGLGPGAGSWDGSLSSAVGTLCWMPWAGVWRAVTVPATRFSLPQCWERRALSCSASPSRWLSWAVGEADADRGNCVLQESNGPTDAYAAIAKADRLTQEPESIRKWREEQKKRLEELDAASKVTEQEWREKAKKDLEEWNLRQNEQMEKNRANNRASEEAFLKESKEEAPGSEWEKVAQLCDFNPKSSKQSKDVSRMRSVLISLKQTPLSR
uniref:Clathrin light chain n=1 Tax=Apteryx owenii TaxID=8824 RepID=A0A8B9PT34_APTOW